LPQVANQLGSWLGQARRMTRMMKRQLEDEINLDLNSVNLEKQLGLDDTPTPASKPSIGQPSYVQDRKPSAGTGTAAATAAASTEAADAAPAEEEAEHELREELPDDYSPAHGADDAGTGVGDEEKYLQTAETAETVAANEADATEDAKNDEPAANPKSETA
ncbi:MAG: hypothetical protein AAGA61_10835, partial [Pseudomonadota bacterium]